MNDDYIYGSVGQSVRLDESMFWRWKFIFLLHDTGYDASWREHYTSIDIIPIPDNFKSNIIPYTFSPTVARMKDLLLSQQEFLKFLTELANYFTEQAINSLS